MIRIRKQANHSVHAISVIYTSTEYKKYKKAVAYH